MPLDGLRERLPIDAEALDGLWSEFGEDDADRFLGWLHEHGHIDMETFVALEGTGDLRIAGLDSIGMLPEASIEMIEDGTVEGYDVLGQVGRGGVGEVLVVREQDLGRRVALKRLLPEVLGERETVSRFYREAQITAQLEHPAIIPVYRLERAGSEIAYTMKLVQGDTLKELIAEARHTLAAHGRLPEVFSLPARIRLLLRACEAVSYAHSRGFMHRDLKPSNIMRGAHGEVYVMDWGIARHVDGNDVGFAEMPFDESIEATQIGVAIGTPAYMAPEQAIAAGDVAGAADQYALGIILQELLTLERARPGLDATELLGAARVAIRRPPQPVAGLEPLDPELVAILDVACAPEQTQRYAGVREFAADLQRYLDDEEVAARPDNVVRRVERSLVRHRHGTLLLLVGLLVIIFASISGGLYRRQTERAADRRADEVMDVLLARASRQSYVVTSAFLAYEGEVRALAAAAEQSAGASTLDRPLRLAVDHGDGVILDAFVGFADGAVAIHPPGDLPEGFDPRQRPWYRQAVGSRDPVWGTPYEDALGRGLMLPCSIALSSDEGFVGVAGLDLALEPLAEMVLAVPELKGVRASSLLDGEGRVLVSTADWLEPLQLHTNDELVVRVQKRGSGMLERPLAGGTELLLYYRLGELEWTWAVEGDRETMLGYSP